MLMKLVTSVLSATVIAVGLSDVPSARGDGPGGSYFQIQFQLREKGWQDPEGRFDTEPEARAWARQQVEPPSSFVGYKIVKHTPVRPETAKPMEQAPDTRKGAALARKKPDGTWEERPGLTVRSRDEDALREYGEFIKTVPGWRMALFGPDAEARRTTALGTPSSPSSTSGKAYNPPKDVKSSLLDTRPTAVPSVPVTRPVPANPELDATRRRLIDEKERTDRAQADIEKDRIPLNANRERLAMNSGKLNETSALIRKGNDRLDDMVDELSGLQNRGAPSITSPAYSTWASRIINLKSDIRELESAVERATTDYLRRKEQHKSEVEDHNRRNQALNDRIAKVNKDLEQYRRDREVFLPDWDADLKRRNAPGDHRPGKP